NQMPDNTTPPFHNGLYTPPPVPRISAVEWLAAILCTLWFVGAIVFFGVLNNNLTFQDDAILQFVVMMMATFLPIAVILTIATASRSTRLMRAESQRLHSAVEHMHQSFAADAQSRQVGLQPSVEKRLDEISDVARQAETAVAVFQSRRGKPDTAPPVVFPDVGKDQPPLALGLNDAAPQPLTADDLIKAFHFPETADDTTGFAALKKALSDRDTGQVIKSAQTVLTLFAEDGIYMDDLKPDRARPDLWRRFADGDRGTMITALGGIRDKTSLALTAGRMRQDADFRQKAHNFLRGFDSILRQKAHDLADTELVTFTNTRSARAFMLLGRVVGIFD
ncbi:MAG: hypothetical protein AAF701_02460, partial [Pseudomonadota bacterium]